MGLGLSYDTIPFHWTNSKHVFLTILQSHIQGWKKEPKMPPTLPHIIYSYSKLLPSYSKANTQSANPLLVNIESHQIIY